MMDRRFDMMEFEQSLKDHADQFRLIPSKRIWNGIYNNLHPGSKWPSMTMAIVIILALISIGYLNNKSSTNLALNVSSVTTVEDVGNNSKPTLPIGRQAKNSNSILENNSRTDAGQNLFNNYDSEQGTRNEKLSVEKSGVKKSTTRTALQYELNRSAVSPKKANSSTTTLLSNTGESITPDQISRNNVYQNDRNTKNLMAGENEISSKGFYLTVKQDGVFLINEKQVTSELANYDLALVSMANTIYVASPPMENSSSPIDAHTPEPKKSFSKKLNIKRNKNIEWTFYITPTISNALFGGSNSSSSTINYSPLTVFQRSSSNGMMYNAKFGFETGAKMTYKLPKKWKFVTGFNLNYSDYNVVSNPIHPTFATLMLRDNATGVLYPKNYITFYGDGQSNYQTGLNNYSLQFSIPVGLEYQVWGNEKMQINVASAIEPSVVLKSHSYIISDDARYYVEDPDLMRKMNLGANLGAFISFGSNKIKWHLGPDVHYQLLSTYKGVYPSQEHLINYGIRIGISKKY